jgi:hypothetical protein
MSSGESFVKQQACIVVLLALAGCAQMPAVTSTQPEKAAAPGEIMSFTIPPDALGARDPQLTAVLAKAGALAAAQPQPAAIRVTALGQDFPYLNQAIWRGVPAQRKARLTLENLTAGANQTYTVSIRLAQ